MAQSNMTPRRGRRLMAQVLRLLYRPKPSYELFIDSDGATPWFSMIAFPRYEEWDSYAVVKVVRQQLRDLAATSHTMDDRRAALLYNRMITLCDVALQGEPGEGEEYDGKIQGD